MEVNVRAYVHVHMYTRKYAHICIEHGLHARIAHTHTHGHSIADFRPTPRRAYAVRKLRSTLFAAIHSPILRTHTHKPICRYLLHCKWARERIYSFTYK